MPGTPDSDALLTAVVRPEMLMLADGAAPNAWLGSVESRRYAGARYVYSVAIEAAPDLDRYHSFEIESDDGGYAEGAAVGVLLLPKPIALLSR